MNQIFTLPLVYKVDCGEENSDVSVYDKDKHQHVYFGTYKTADIKIGRNDEWICKRNGSEESFDIILPPLANTKQVYPANNDDWRDVPACEESDQGIIYLPRHREFDRGAVSGLRHEGWYHVSYNDMCETPLGKRIIPGVFLIDGEKELTLHDNRLKLERLAFKDYETSVEETYVRSGSGPMMGKTVKAEIIKISFKGKDYVKFFRFNRFVGGGDVEFKGKNYYSLSRYEYHEGRKPDF